MMQVIASARAGPSGIASAKDGLEELAEISSLSVREFRFLSWMPTRRWLEIPPCARPKGAQAVILCPLFGVLQDFVSLTEGLEALFRIGLFADIGVVTPSQTPVRLLDFIGGCLRGYLHNGVVVDESHVRLPVS
jgi:hypothetical protein